MISRRSPKPPKPRYSVLLTDARHRKGWSAEQVADKLGVNRSTYTNAENGRGGPAVFTDTLREVFPEDADEVLAAWEESNALPGQENSEGDGDVLGASGTKRPLDGEWHALWQTSADGRPNFNTEVLDASWKKRYRLLNMANRAASDENVAGGFRWHATLEVFEGTYLMGTYLPTEDHVTSKGTMYGVVNRSGRYLEGIWAGCNIDSELMSGRFVFARNRADLATVMARALGMAAREIGIPDLQ